MTGQFLSMPPGGRVAIVLTSGSNSSLSRVCISSISTVAASERGDGGGDGVGGQQI